MTSRTPAEGQNLGDAAGRAKDSGRMIAEETDPAGRHDHRNIVEAIDLAPDPGPTSNGNADPTGLDDIHPRGIPPSILALLRDLTRPNTAREKATGLFVIFAPYLNLFLRVVWIFFKSFLKSFILFLLCAHVAFRFRLLSVEGLDSDGPYLLRVFLQRPFRDFAVYSGGARIVHSKTSPTVSAKPWGVTTTPEQAISPGLYLGSCWPMAGSTGQLTIRLARPINVTQVTVEHLSWVAAYNIYSAPKKIEVWGSIDNVEQLQKAEQYVLSQKFSDSPILGDPLVSGIIGKKKRFLKLSSFTYHPHPFVSSNIQTYPVSKGLRGRGIQSSEVIFRILSNWGFPDYTCIYRVRVHD